MMRKLVVLVALAILLITEEVPSSQANAAKVDIKNALSAGKRLIAHCRSKDDDIGAQVIEEGSSLHWSFEAVSETLFWCNLAVEDRRLSFTVYDRSSGDDIGGNFVDWVVMDDGAHLALWINSPEPIPRHKWRSILFAPRHY
ncbi:unnamed protein product [Linum tenue]|uniref:S-protein homolog n=1 Tax=Linum tenue TaxID=586396 RepID=A0AAV0IK11_9ROSI|nr:unnamed protein product [Linum tenue]